MSIIAGVIMPYMPLIIFAPEGESLKEGELQRWNNRIDLPKKEPGYYNVELLFPDRTVVKSL